MNTLFRTVCRHRICISSYSIFSDWTSELHPPFVRGSHDTGYPAPPHPGSGHQRRNSGNKIRICSDDSSHTGIRNPSCCLNGKQSLFCKFQIMEKLLKQYELIDHLIKMDLELNTSFSEINFICDHILLTIIIILEL